MKGSGIDIDLRLLSFTGVFEGDDIGVFVAELDSWRHEVEV